MGGHKLHGGIFSGHFCTCVALLNKSERFIFLSHCGWTLFLYILFYFIHHLYISYMFLSPDFPSPYLSAFHMLCLSPLLRSLWYLPYVMSFPSP
ncbi:hypothetical protein GDO86_019032 [Hymenochirus boettgeri]|uniref:Uncharacterized protein n=1 Tax=Hymenochirus boettgeri TaxID=247094 RepID=A0A8T2IFC0_9PIPI|nr:hypothetical protein GDO86_019032 [Hymenochirus boettgeri]